MCHRVFTFELVNNNNRTIFLLHCVRHILFYSIIPLSLFCSSLRAEHDSVSTVSIPRLAGIGGITTAGFIYGHGLQNNLWWKGEKTSFYINTHRDWEYALGADKLGHCFFASMVSTTYSHLFQWSGVDTLSSLYAGAGIALAYQTYIEIRDGFSRDNGGGYLGFSPGDMVANTVGAAIPLMKYYLPSLQPLSLQISFDWKQYDPQRYGAIIDDYENTTHWLSIGSEAFIPVSWRNSWYPSWIGLSLGHSVQQLNGYGGGTHELYLSLYWDIRKIPVSGGLWDSIIAFASQYRLPAPAIRILPEITWYGLKL